MTWGRDSLERVPKPRSIREVKVVAGKVSPVTASVVAWAIGEDGRPLPELADAIKVEADVLRSWAVGEQLPTVGQVTDLARVLQRPRALFFMRQPPQVGLPTAFRHAPGDESRQLDADTRRRVRQARRLQHGIAWALRGHDDVDLPRAGLDATPESIAATVREWLGMSGDAHGSWGDGRAAFEAWRAALERRGILVFTPQLGAHNIRGFSAWDTKAPLVAANVSGYPFEARVFTIAHELGHLVTRMDSACVDLGAPGTSVPVERWCEAFGAALLMPLSLMHALAAERRIETHRATLDDVKSVAARFKVSHRAAALRLIDLNLARRELYAVVLDVFRPRPRPKVARDDFKQPRRSTARLREYGAHTVELALSELPPRDAMSMLRISVEDAREIADKVPGVPGF